MMYICKDCGAVFNDADLMEYNGEYFTACPICGSRNFEETGWCKSCNAVVPKSKVYDGICDDCASEAAKKLYAYINGSDFTEPEREYVKTKLEGII